MYGLTDRIVRTDTPGDAVVAASSMLYRSPSAP